MPDDAANSFATGTTAEKVRYYGHPTTHMIIEHNAGVGLFDGEDWWHPWDGATVLSANLPGFLDPLRFQDA